MGGACSQHGGDKKLSKWFWLESLQGRRHWEDQDVDERLIIRGLRKTV